MGLIDCAKERDHWTANFRQKGESLLALLANLSHLPLVVFQTDA